MQEFFCTYYKMNTLLKELSKEVSPVIDTRLNRYVPIDISLQNKELTTFDTQSSAAWETYIHNYLAKHEADIAYGGYLEVRNLYDRSTHFSQDTHQDKRNIHLGVDFWCTEGTPILAPLEGTVHSFQNNTAYGDYGPTIILEHQVAAQTFYTLYGHLSKASLDHLFVGKRVNKGEVFATLGGSDVNGDYAPHLHFQCIVDVEGKQGDYPGVCSKSTLSFYQQNCPNPLLLLGI